jgi:hypothetical protein
VSGVPHRIISLEWCRSHSLVTRGMTREHENTIQWPMTNNFSFSTVQIHDRCIQYNMCEYALMMMMVSHWPPTTYQTRSLDSGMQSLRASYYSSSAYLLRTSFIRFLHTSNTFKIDATFVGCTSSFLS